jgi:hypothetical protein
MGIFKASDKEIAEDIHLSKKHPLHDFYMSDF